MARKNHVLRGIKFSTLAVILEIVFIVLIAFFGRYDAQADPKNDEVNLEEKPTNDVYKYTGVFMDVHVMVFIGFGFLMTFLKRYSYSSVSMNLFIAALVIQWALIVRGFIHSAHDEHYHINLGIKDMIAGDFAAATILISFGAVLGKISPTQLIVLAMIETPLVVVNEYIGVDIFKVVDIGGSMFIHTFGAYFGIFAARVIYKKHHLDDPKEGAVYHSDVFAMIGTVFLWMFWPSFNGALGVGDEQHRAFVNTYLSLCACAVSAFAFSYLFSKEQKFDMVHIQNATIAGGVAIGTCADLPVQPYAALTIGAVAGLVSVLGYRFILPLLRDKLKFHDTCGVNNLHGLPGIIGATAGIIACATAEFSNYGRDLYQIFPQRAPSVNQTINDEHVRALINTNQLEYGDGLTASDQAINQLAALGITMGISIVGGIFAGIVLALPIWDQPDPVEVFNDEQNWEVAPEWASNSYTIVRSAVDGGDDQVLEMTLNGTTAEKVYVD